MWQSDPKVGEILNEILYAQYTDLSGGTKQAASTPVAVLKKWWKWMAGAPSFAACASICTELPI